MKDTRSISRQDPTIGDAAVEGLFSGLVSGIAMAAYLVVTGLFYGEGPLQIISRFAVSVDSTPLVGLLLHLGVSAVYGTFYGLIYRLIARPFGLKASTQSVALIGSIYGLFLWLLAKFALIPAYNSQLAETPAGHLLLAHLIFGLSLAYLTKLESEPAN